MQSTNLLPYHKGESLVTMVYQNDPKDKNHWCNLTASTVKEKLIRSIRSLVNLDKDPYFSGLLKEFSRVSLVRLKGKKPAQVSRISGDTEMGHSRDTDVYLLFTPIPVTNGDSAENDTDGHTGLTVQAGETNSVSRKRISSEDPNQSGEEKKKKIK